MKNKSRQAEAAGRARRIKTSTVPSFATRHQDGYFSCQVLGHEVRMRFDYVWTAYCPDLNKEIQFTNRTDDTMIIFLTDWLTDLIDQPQSPADQLRQAIPSVLYLAEYHGIATFLADEIMKGR